MSARSFLTRFQTSIWSLEDRMNLRQQIGVAAGALCLVIVAAIAFGAAIVGERQAREAATNELSAVAFALADRLDRTIIARLNTLQLLAGMEALQPLWTSDPAALRGVLNDILPTVSGASWMGFADREGVIRAGFNGWLEGQSVAAEPWFKDGLTGATVKDFHGDERLARLIGPSPDGRADRFVDIAVPVKNRLGETLGVLALQKGSAWLTEARQSTLDRRGTSEKPDLWILSRNGEIVLGPQLNAVPFPPDVVAGMTGAGRGSLTAEADGGELLVGFALSEGRAPWFLAIAQQPAWIAFQTSRGVIWTIVVLGVLIGAVGIVGATLIAGRVARPIVRLTETADKLGRDSTDMLPRVRGSREVVQLSSALRSLVFRIGFAERQTAEAEMRAANEARKFSHDLEVLRNLAETDALTRLLNRRTFLAFASDAMEHYRRYRRGFAVLMLDIDRFKSINDSLGHAAGDTVIAWVAGEIVGAIRPSDKAGRFGGEEFIVLVHEVSADGARETAERIRREVAASPISFNGNDLFVTLSIGVAMVKDNDRDVQEVIERADLALYAAKASGRNAVAAAPVVEVQPLRRSA